MKHMSGILVALLLIWVSSTGLAQNQNTDIKNKLDGKGDDGAAAIHKTDITEQDHWNHDNDPHLTRPQMDIIQKNVRMKTQDNATQRTSEMSQRKLKNRNMEKKRMETWRYNSDSTVKSGTGDVSNPPTYPRSGVNKGGGKKDGGSKKAPSPKGTPKTR